MSRQIPSPNAMLAAVVVGAALSGCAQPPAPAPPQGPVQASTTAASMRNCIDTLAGRPEFSQFVGGVNASHLVQDMREANNLTVFAPTNAAVNSMGTAVRDRLFPQSTTGQGRSGTPESQSTIAGHVVQGRHQAAELARGLQFTTVAGTPLRTAASGGTVIVQGAGNSQARITQPDIPCSNGIIQGIDTVLVR
jgi:uncharacterized surface protein with fasciclin (FAS1) repeats